VISRRRFLELGVLGAGAAVSPACVFGAGAETGGPQDGGRLSARPSGPPGESVEAGRQALSLGTGRDGILFVPKSYRADVPAPLVMMLHGAGGSANGGIRPFETLAEEKGMVLLVPESRGPTWDVITGRFGADVSFIDAALARVFARCRIDPSRIAVEGFSDGASYALSLGLTNGDLFRRIVAFSPGFMVVNAPLGKPSVFVSHGTGDKILPIRQTSRELVPQLRTHGYAVRYTEFDGGHTVPPTIAAEAATWLLQSP
jgi:predicted esterase